MNETDKERVHRAKTAILGSPFTGAGSLEKFMGTRQRMAVHHLLNGEEAAGMAELILGLADRIAAAPRTYDQEDKGDAAVVSLHYFGPNVDVWITELDRDDAVSQAFGFTRFAQCPDEAELGYIHIPELLANGLELDLHWAPKTLAEVKRP